MLRGKVMADSRFFQGMAVITTLLSVGLAFDGRMKESAAFGMASLILSLMSIVT